MRTFLAADLDAAFLDAVASRGAPVADRLRGAPRLSNARWVAREAMHVTLRFFGETTDAQIEALRALVTSLGEGALASDVRAVAVTGFPSASHARVLVLELEDGGTLASYAQRAESVAQELGFTPEPRAYRAHLTLARMKQQPVDVRPYADEATALPEARVTALTLYASTTAPTGPVYAPLARVSLPAR